LAVANFVGLAEGTLANEAFEEGTPYYDGSVFHRVVEGHVIQAGAPDPERSEARGPGYTFPNEIHADLSHDHAGALGVANGGPHTNSAQFYITLGDRSYLDGDYIVFGDVVEGMDVVHGIEQGDVIESVRIVRRGAEAEAFRPDTASFEAMVAEAEERVRNDEVDRRRLERRYQEERFSTRNLEVWLEGTRHVLRRRGRGPRIAAGQRVSVRYVAIALRYRGHMLGVQGSLFEEVEFGGSPEDGSPQWIDSPTAAPVFEYEVGVTQVNPGFDRAIREMRRGSQHIVILPHPLAYPAGFYGPNVAGERRFVIPPGTMVIYAIEILDR
jgi:peptidylprolyl isomerase